MGNRTQPWLKVPDGSGCGNPAPHCFGLAGSGGSVRTSTRPLGSGQTKPSVGLARAFVHCPSVQPGALLPSVAVLLGPRLTSGAVTVAASFKYSMLREVARVILRKRGPIKLFLAGLVESFLGAPTHLGAAASLGCPTAWPRSLETSFSLLRLRDSRKREKELLRLIPSWRERGVHTQNLGGFPIPPNHLPSKWQRR